MEPNPIQNQNVQVTPAAPVPTPQPPTTEQVGGPGPKGHGLLWTIIILVIVLIVGGAYYYIFANQQPCCGPVQAKITTLSPIEILKVEKVATVAEEKNYDEYLARKVDAENLNTSNDDLYIQSGNVAVKTEGGARIVVAFTPLPNVHLDEANISVAFSSVKDFDGNEVLDATSPFETDSFFTTERPEAFDEPIPHMVVDRSPHLIETKDKSEIEIAYVKGSLDFKLPIGVKSSKLVKTDLGKKNSTSSGTTTVTKFDATVVELNYEGFKKNVLSVTGYDAFGKALDCSISTSGDSKGYDTSSYTLKCPEDSVISYVVIADASGFINKKVPFEADFTKGKALTKDLSAATSNVTAPKKESAAPDSSGLTSSEKNLIIEAKVKMFQALSSKDLKNIKDYLRAGVLASGDKAQLEKFDKTSDKEIMQGASLMAAFAFGGMGSADEIRSQLGGKDVVWTKDVKNGVEHVSMSYKDSDGSKITIDAMKINGTWF